MIYDFDDTIKLIVIIIQILLSINKGKDVWVSYGLCFPLDLLLSWEHMRYYNGKIPNKLRNLSEVNIIDSNLLTIVLFSNCIKIATS